MATLNAADVTDLLKDPSPANRAEAARKVGGAFNLGGLGAKERAIAEDIFKIMVRDAEVRVRKALSETLKANPEIPREVALALAQDVAEVAIPVLESSSVLTDADLMRIIDSQGEDYQAAVARREKVSESVSERLVEKGTETVVAALVANPGAKISDQTLNKVVDQFGASEAVNAPLAQRAYLPLAVAERLVSLVSDSLQRELMAKHALSADVAADLIFESREKATVSLLKAGAQVRDVIDLVDELFTNGRLTPTLVMRALCMGDVTFFEAAIARKVGIPVANAYKLIHDKGDLGLTRLFDKAGYSKDMLRVARVALNVAEELSASGRDDRDLFRKLMIERILTQFESGFDPENLDYFIKKLGGKA